MSPSAKQVTRGPSPKARRLDRFRQGRSFTLVELVVVVVIISIVAAIAVPRFSQATTSATNAYLDATIAAVRRAITFYYAEHGQYPGADPDTGVTSGAVFVDQLLLYSDEAGHTQATRGTPFIYGPYLRDPFPTNPFNKLDTVGVKATAAGTVPSNSTGWIAVRSNGDFGINATAADLGQVTVDPSKFEVMGGV
ncbi:MAG: prepilin-type N-terminal cleavage/methylation domain-containing protein [Phycisphaerae bacterium]